MAHEEPLRGHDSGDAPTLKQNSVTRAATPSRQRTTKKKNGEMNEAGQPPETEGMSKDQKYRGKVKRERQEVDKENNDLKAENQELKYENKRLKSDKDTLEKDVLKGEIKALKFQGELEKEKVEKRYIQRELEITKEKLQTQTEVLEECFKPWPNVLAQGSVSLHFLLKLLKIIQRELEITNKKLQTRTEVLEECFKLLSNVPGHGSAKISCFDRSKDWSDGGDVLGNVEGSDNDERMKQLMNPSPIDQNLSQINQTNPTQDFCLQQGTTESLAPHVETNQGHRQLNEAAETSTEPSRRSSRAKPSGPMKQMLVDLIKEMRDLAKGTREMVPENELMKIHIQRLEMQISELKSELNELKTNKQGGSANFEEWIEELSDSDIAKELEKIGVDISK